jgi:RimJ/RimL family protein N-acetyltransferase
MRIAPAEIVAARARLRRLREADFAEFARMNADPEVMRYFPKPWTEEESRAAFDKVNAEFDQRGFGVYALQADEQFAGVVGLSVPSFQSWFTPCVEILWRLQPQFWGRGLATEAAGAVMKMAADELALEKVFAFAVAQNRASIRVMQKIGMTPCDPPSFDHPDVDDPSLRHHLLYSIQLRAALP